MPEHTCAFILAGGRGTRLRPVTSVLPKPLIPVNDLPIGEIVIRQLRQAGFNRVILAVHHQQDLLHAYFGDGRRFGVRIAYTHEPAPLGTVGPLGLAADALPEHFLVMNADLLTDLDFRSFLDAHVAAQCHLTVATCRRRHQIRDGVLDIAPDDRLVGFREKPAHHYWISIGIYAMGRTVLEFIPPNRPLGMDELVRDLLARGETVRIHRHAGAWFDIGKPRDLRRAGAAFAEDRSRYLPSDTTPVAVAATGR